MAERVLVRNGQGMTMWAWSDSIPPGYRRVAGTKASLEGQAAKDRPQKWTRTTTPLPGNPFAQTAASWNRSAGPQGLSGTGQPTGGGGPKSLRDLIAQGPIIPEEEADPRAPIGGVDPQMLSPYTGGSDFAKMGTYRQGPLYFEGDEFGIRSWSVERVGQLQRHLAQAGLLEGSFRLGRADLATISAYKSLLGAANYNGKSAQQMLYDLRTSPMFSVDEDGNIVDGGEGAEEGYVRQPFPDDVYEPDYAAMTDAVMQTFRDRLRRDPTAEEREQYIDGLLSADRRRFEIAQEIARAEHEAEQTEAAAMFEGRTVDVEPEVDPALLEESPVADFWTQFDEANRGEIGNIAQSEAHELGRRSLMGTMSSMDRLIGGGR